MKSFTGTGNLGGLDEALLSNLLGSGIKSTSVSKEEDEDDVEDAILQEVIGVSKEGGDDADDPLHFLWTPGIYALFVNSSFFIR